VNAVKPPSLGIHRVILALDPEVAGFSDKIMRRINAIVTPTSGASKAPHMKAAPGHPARGEEQ
jgi:hypothetical protein